MCLLFWKRILTNITIQRTFVSKLMCFTRFLCLKNVVKMVLKWDLFLQRSSEKKTFVQILDGLWRSNAVAVQSLGRVGLFATPWTAACQASLSFTISRSLLKPCAFRQSIQPSHPLSPTSPALNLVGSSHQVAKVLKLQLRHQSFQWIFRVDFL